MSNNFIKKPGRVSDNPDIPQGDLSVKILASDSADVISKNLRSWVITLSSFNFTSAKCLEFYISAPHRTNYKGYFSLTELFGLPIERFTDIARKNYSTAGKDYLAFYGYNAMSRGNLYVYKEKIKNYLIENVRYAVQKKLPKEQILKFYAYENIPEIIRNKDVLSDNDFYFAVGDGNSLYGQVHTIDLEKKQFQILFVLYDEYNWDDNVTYFIKLGLENEPYRVIVETAAFKKLEKEGMAKPFLQFFVDTYTVSYR